MNPLFSSQANQQDVIFNVFTAFFLDLYYNQIYRMACDVAMQKNISKTAAYQHQVRAFIVSVRQDQVLYRNLVRELTSYCEAHTNGLMRRFSEFEALSISAFVPEDYARELTTQQRDRIMFAIIVEIVSTLGVKMLQPTFLHGVIDARSDRDKIDDLKLYGYTSLRILRDTISTKYVEKVAGPSIAGSAAERDNIHKTVERLIKAKIAAERELVEVKSKLAKTAAQAEKLLQLCRAQQRQLSNHPAAAEIAEPSRAAGREAQALRVAGREAQPRAGGPPPGAGGPPPGADAERGSGRAGFSEPQLVRILDQINAEREENLADSIFDFDASDSHKESSKSPLFDERQRNGDEDEDKNEGYDEEEIDDYVLEDS